MRKLYQKQKIQLANQETQYDKIDKEYSALTEMDPSKKYVQYPSALKLLGDIEDSRILDIGCGDGIFTRQLAKKGADMVGYDISKKQIEKANEREEKQHLGIQYEVAAPGTFKSKEKFDKAVSVLVLLYAKDKEHLKKFFLSAYNHLKPNSEFISITFNPNFKRLGQIVYNRIFSKTDNGKMRVDFFNDKQEKTFSADFTDLSISNYEEAAKNAGFKKIEWKNLKIEKEGSENLEENFWKDYEDDCPYIGLAVKNKL